MESHPAKTKGRHPAACSGIGKSSKRDSPCAQAYGLLFFRFLWNGGDVMADFLDAAFTMLGTFYAEFTHQFAERRLSLDIAFLHAKRPRNQFTHVLNECSITITSRECAFKLLLAHSKNCSVGKTRGRLRLAQPYRYPLITSAAVFAINSITASFTHSAALSSLMVTSFFLAGVTSALGFDITN